MYPKLTVESLTGSTHERLAPGERGTRQTLRRMGERTRDAHADPTIRAIADEVTRGIHGHDFKAKADALFRHARTFIVYQRDRLMGEHVQDPRVTFKRKRGDCDDKASYLAALLAAIGIRSRFVAVTFDNQTWQHVYLIALINGRWIAYDPTPERAQPGQFARGCKLLIYGIFDKEADRLGDVSQLIAAGINLGSTLAASSGGGGSEREINNAFDALARQTNQVFAGVAAKGVNKTAADYETALSAYTQLAAFASQYPTKGIVQWWTSPSYDASYQRQLLTWKSEIEARVIAGGGTTGNGTTGSTTGSTTTGGTTTSGTTGQADYTLYWIGGGAFVAYLLLTRGKNQ